ncbi:MAG: HNH endonuclease [Chloroflexi bacterium]|nr:HNH endonuclease [Chloroflexota bacterium]
MPKSYISIETKRRVFDRAYGYCEYCQSPSHYGTSSFQIEHIVPTSRGGDNGLRNLALSCPGCNGYKSDRIEAIDPADGELVPLYNPRKQTWHEHFNWNEQYSLILGITATGRATVEALQVNRTSLVNLRHALYMIGKHPPRVED